MQWSTSLFEPFIINTTVSLTPLVRVVPKEVSLHVSRVERWPVVRNIMLIGPRTDKLKCELQSRPPSWMSVEVPTVTDSNKPMLLQVVIQKPADLESRSSAPIQLRMTIAGKEAVLVDIPITVIPD